MNPTALFRRSPTWSSTDADRRSDRGVGRPLSAARAWPFRSRSTARGGAAELPEEELSLPRPSERAV